MPDGCTLKDGLHVWCPMCGELTPRGLQWWIERDAKERRRTPDDPAYASWRTNCPHGDSRKSLPPTP